MTLILDCYILISMSVLPKVRLSVHKIYSAQLSPNEVPIHLDGTSPHGKPLAKYVLASMEYDSIGICHTTIYKMADEGQPEEAGPVKLFDSVIGRLVWLFWFHCSYKSAESRDGGTTGRPRCPSSGNSFYTLRTLLSSSKWDQLRSLFWDLIRLTLRFDRIVGNVSML